MATYYFRNTGSALWNLASNWSLTDGGGATGAIPTSSDDAKLTANSGASCTPAAGDVCKSLDCTGYTGNFGGTTIATFGDVKFVAGMTISTSGSLALSGSGNLTSGGVVFSGGLTFLTAGQTYVLQDAWTINGGVGHTSSGGAVTMNGFSLTIKGGYTGSSGRNLSGTTKIIFGGTGTQTINLGNVSSIANSVDIDTTGTVILTANYFCAGGTFRVLNGTLDVTTNNNTFNCITASSSLDFNTHAINNLTVSGASITVSFDSLPTINGTVLISQSMTFSGAYGFTCNTFSCITAGRTITFKAGNTYTITTFLNLKGTATSKINIVSSTPSTAYYFILNGTATCNVIYVSSTDADSSGGRIIHNVKGVLLRTVNWYIANPDFFQLF